MTSLPPLPPCVRSKRFRVYRQQAHMFPTCGLGAGTHADVWNVHTESFWTCTRFFSCFFTVPQHTNTHHDHQQHHDHNDTHHITQHGDRKRERQRKRRRDKTRKEKTRQVKKQDKRWDEMKKKRERDERGRVSCFSHCERFTSVGHIFSKSCHRHRRCSPSPDTVRIDRLKALSWICGAVPFLVGGVKLSGYFR